MLDVDRQRSGRLDGALDSSRSAWRRHDHVARRADVVLLSATVPSMPSTAIAFVAGVEMKSGRAWPQGRLRSSWPISADRYAFLAAHVAGSAWADWSLDVDPDDPRVPQYCTTL